MSGADKREADIKIYEWLTGAVRNYFRGADVQYMFLHGGCYWLAAVLHRYIPDSVIVFNRKMQHCACLFGGGVYDIRGRIPSRGFSVATAEDMKYMREHFIPSFDVEKLEKHLMALAVNKNGGKEDDVSGKQFET